MPQTWNPEKYLQHAAYVPALGGGAFEWLNPQPKERILDLGCGDGQLTVRLAAAGATVTGVDLSPDMVAAARTRGIPADQASAEKLPYSDRTFDAIFSNAALHWVHDHDAMLAEAHRVLKPGGRFVAEFGGHGNIAAIRTALTAVLDHHGLTGREKNVNYFPTPEAYSRRLARHGFNVERIALIPRPTPLGEGGMIAWLKLFRRGVLDSLPESLRDTIIQETTELLANVLRDEEGNWTADYIRLRFVATA